MSNHVAYKRQQKIWAGGLDLLLMTKCIWFVLKDKKGKVRDWTAAKNAKCAWNNFKEYREVTGSIPKGYSVERRGPVTRENW